MVRILNGVSNCLEVVLTVNVEVNIVAGTNWSEGIVTDVLVGYTLGLVQIEQKCKVVPEIFSLDEQFPVVGKEHDAVDMGDIWKLLYSEGFSERDKFLQVFLPVMAIQNSICRDDEVTVLPRKPVAFTETFVDVPPSAFLEHFETLQFSVLQVLDLKEFLEEGEVMDLVMVGENFEAFGEKVFETDATAEVLSVEAKKVANFGFAFEDSE